MSLVLVDVLLLVLSQEAESSHHDDVDHGEEAHRNSLLDKEGEQEGQVNQRRSTILHHIRVHVDGLADDVHKGECHEQLERKKLAILLGTLSIHLHLHEVNRK